MRSCHRLYATGGNPVKAFSPAMNRLLSAASTRTVSSDTESAGSVLAPEPGEIGILRNR